MAQHRHNYKHTNLYLLNITDRWLNTPNPEKDHIFSVLIETIMLFEKCPAGKEEFEANFNIIEQEVNHKIEALNKLKKDLNKKNMEYCKIFNDLDPDFDIKGASLFLEIILSQKDFMQFLFNG